MSERYHIPKSDTNAHHPITQSPETSDPQLEWDANSDVMHRLAAAASPHTSPSTMPTLTSRDILQLQRTVGNQRTLEIVQQWQQRSNRAVPESVTPPRFFRDPPPPKPAVQRKPEPPDAETADDEAVELEQEADTDLPFELAFDQPMIQPCPCEDEEPVQRTPSDTADPAADVIQRGIVGDIKKGVKKAVNKVKKAGKKFGKWAGKPFKWVINKAKKLARKLLKPVKRAAQSAFSRVCEMIGGILPDFEFNLGKLIPLNADWIRAAIKKLFSGAAAFARLLKALIGDIVGFIKPILSKLLSAISLKISLAFRNLFKGFRWVWGKIPGISAPKIDLSAVDKASKKAMGHAMTGAHKVNALRAQSKRGTSRGGKLGKAIGSVMAPVRKSIISMFEGCLKNVPLMNSLVASVQTMLEKFKSMVLQVGDTMVMESVDQLVQDSPCSDGESSATLQAGVSVPIGGIVSVQGAKSLEIAKRSSSQVAFTHMTERGVTFGAEYDSSDKGDDDKKPENGEQEEEQRKNAMKKEAAASLGINFGDGETYVYNPTKEGEMLAAGLHTFYRAGLTSGDPMLPLIVEGYGGLIEGATGMDIPMPEDNLESRTTSLGISLALSAQLSKGVGSLGFDYSNNGTAILEEFTSGERRIATEMSGGLSISASLGPASAEIGTDDEGADTVQEYMGKDVSISGSTMILEVLVNKDGSVKEVAYVISAETPSTSATEMLMSAVMPGVAGEYAAGQIDEKLPVSYSEAGEYEMRFVVRQGLDRLNTHKLKQGDATDFLRVIHQIQEYGELEYITQSSTRSFEASGEEGNAEFSFGISQSTQQHDYRRDENGNLRDECK